jgi:hypothetical protein
VEFQQLTTQSYVQNTSGLNITLVFLQILLKHFPSLSVLKTDPRAIDLVLAGCRTVGDEVVDPRFGECEITQRSIGDRFGVLYTMKTPKSPLSSSTEMFESFLSTIHVMQDVSNSLCCG